MRTTGKLAAAGVVSLWFVAGCSSTRACTEIGAIDTISIAVDPRAVR